MKKFRLAAVLVLGLAGSGLLSSQAADGPKDTSSATAPKAASTAFTNIKVAEFERLRTGTNTVVLDVRTKGEFDKGHIPGAINIDVLSDAWEKEVATLDKSKTYLVHCAAGSRSVRACGKLNKLQFGKLYNLEGGYSEWEETVKK